jgi:PEGA domain-containing protein
MASRPPYRRSQSPLRTVLIAVVAFLAIWLVVVLVIRSNRKGRPADVPAETTAAPPADTSAAPRADMALLRAHRAQAVDAIETGDYDSAVKTLTEIVRSGRGVGDEPELLRIAKDLQEKHSSKSAPAVAVREPPPPEPAPAVKEARAEPPKEKEPPPPKEKEKKPEPKHATKPTKPPTREERKVASAKPVPVIPDREPESGQVLVMSVPSGLSAEVDGASAGSTPTRFTTAPGVHTVTLFKGGQKVAERTVTVSENAVATADFDIRDQLQPAPVVLKEAREPEKEKEAPPPPPAEEKQPDKTAKVEPPPALPPTTPASAAAGTGEVMVPPMSLAGNVFINGKSYGPPPVLARDIPAGNATVELRVGDAVKRSKVIPVEAHQRATVKFR